ncbi:rhodanese-like domain-containing protein [Aurantimonas sp. Leaf443]|uniref:rhodanese-like domain-containing protein n=1 Tax=Aurantimonas sp. Leaf443 TaxID=1736378 RepID=UPI0006FA5DCA|nr:rhodanese-like domain-containing protein [Aurantimonas sp. Leaf443]KQT83908.1 sulfurtransferase [Aurantimonas sp. Leaf443]
MTSHYKGDVTAGACWQSLGQTPDALLIDVRTVAEWTYVGLPVLASIGKAPILVEWQRYPSMNVDPSAFADQVEAEIRAAGAGKNSELYFLCRSGVRSMGGAAAMAARGYINCFNVLDGFEGPVDGEGHRGLSAGWKAEGLPWAQK